MKTLRTGITLAVIAAATLLALCRKPGIPPDKPVIVFGPEHGGINTSYEFAATATHPDNQQVAIRFDWGSKVSDWGAFVSSGDTVRMSHTWTNPGTYAVKAQARVVAGAESEWTETRSITVMLNQPPGTPSVPRGPSTAPRDSSCYFSTMATDPDGDGVSYRFDWGNGDTSTWSAWTYSGLPGGMHHAYSHPGTYQVRAQARDVNEALSAWSDPLTVAISVGYLGVPQVSYEAVSQGGQLRLAWGQVAFAEGYRVEVDSMVYTTATTIFVADGPARRITVSAFSGETEGGKWALHLGPRVTAAIEVWGISDPNPDNPCAFGFNTDGTITTYSINAANYPAIDYYMEDVQLTPMHIVNPGDRGWNAKGNAAKAAGTTDFDAATVADAPDGYITQQQLAVGVVYFLWLDRNNNNWDVTDNFAKAKVIAMHDGKVTLQVAYQKVGGLRWLVTR